jgi:molybdenum cofactor biosynthesis protein MoaC
LTSSGEAHMVSVTLKSDTSRRAIAIGHVAFSNSETLLAVKNALIKKGDVLGTARLAGIMAAKNCPALIPLCHPILITAVNVDVRLVEPTAKTGDHGGVEVEAEVQCTGKTGVEMEALTSVTGALLTVIDMVKAVDKGTRMTDVRMVLKEGGRSGRWVDAAWENKSN